jgi:hypothetical protein
MFSISISTVEMREYDLMEQSSKDKIAETTCPLCGKEESIRITESDITKAKKNHKLIAKAIQHEKEGHILALYADTEGIVRRRYCFEIEKKYTSKSRKYAAGSLEDIFTQMLQNSRKLKRVIHNLNEFKL